MRQLLRYIHGGLLICVLFTFPVLASPSLPAGHMLDKINLTQGTTDTFLSVLGTLAPDQFSKIEIKSNKTDPITKIIIPNCFINNLNLPKYLNFPTGEILRSITVDENIQKKENGEISFEVTLHLQAPEPLIVKFDEVKSNQKEMIFVLRKEKNQLTPPSIPTTVPQKSPAVEVASLSKSLPETLKQGTTPPEVPMDSEPIMPIQGEELENVLLHPVSAMLLLQRPKQLQLSILNASHQMDGAQRLAILIQRHHRRALEDRVGMKLEISNISSVRERIILPKTKIYFRPNYLDAALALSTLIPGEQIVEQMPLERRGKLGIDVEIYVGENFE
ncbi:LytR C-terminal domain-containing protein [Deltaproteobacteria bacterium TL4]